MVGHDEQNNKFTRFSTIFDRARFIILNIVVLMLEIWSMTEKYVYIQFNTEKHTHQNHDALSIAGNNKHNLIKKNETVFKML